MPCLGCGANINPNYLQCEYCGRYYQQIKSVTNISGNVNGPVFNGNIQSITITGDNNITYQGNNNIINFG